MAPKTTVTVIQSFAGTRTITSDNIKDMTAAIEILSSSDPIHVSTVPVSEGAEDDGNTHRAILLWCHPTCVYKTEEQGAEEEQAALAEESKQVTRLKRMHDRNKAERDLRRQANAASSFNSFRTEARPVAKTEQDDAAVDRATYTSERRVQSPVPSRGNRKRKNTKTEEQEQQEQEQLEWQKEQEQLEQQQLEQQQQEQQPQEVVQLDGYAIEERRPTEVAKIIAKGAKPKSAKLAKTTQPQSEEATQTITNIITTARKRAQEMDNVTLTPTNQ